MDTPDEIIIADPEPIIDAIDDVQDDAQELVDEIRTLETSSGTRHTELLERITTCQTQLEALSNRERDSLVESPMLTQIVSQLTQIQSELSEAKTELVNLKRSMVSRQPNQEPSELIVEDQTVLDSPNQGVPIDVVDHVENPTEPKPPKRRWA